MEIKMKDWKRIAKKEFKKEFEDFQHLLKGKGGTNINRGAKTVDFTDIKGDVQRRDLTINALFYDIDRKEIVDLVGGIKDLQDKKVRTVGSPQLRFEEDPLRKMRALRFNSALGGTMEEQTYEALKADPSLKGVSPERIRDEFVKGLKKAKSTKHYLDTATDVGMMKYILPNLSVSKPFIDTSDYIVLLSFILRNNDKETLSKRLNKLTYTTEEVRAITFLNLLQTFTPEKIVTYKKLQKITNLTDKQILDFGDLIGKNFGKFLKFELSVQGGDVMNQGFKGAEIGKEIERQETEKFVNEGGKATGGSPIPGELTGVMYDEVVRKIKGDFKLTEKDFRPLGSTGKKGKGQFSGDIDIAVDALKVGAKNKLSFDEVFDFIADKAKSKFNNVVANKGTGVVSFLYPIPKTDEFGQVDFMLSDDLDLTSFAFHSPDFTKNESKYKGIYRNLLLYSVLSNLDTGDVDVLYDDEFDGKYKGQVKQFSKFSMSNKKGLLKQVKSYEGKIKRLTKSKPIRGKDVLITKVPDEIVKFVLGKEYGLRDAVSFESMYKIISSSSYVHKKKYNKIINDFKNAVVNNGLPLPTEIE